MNKSLQPLLISTNTFRKLIELAKNENIDINENSPVSEILKRTASPKNQTITSEGDIKEWIKQEDETNEKLSDGGKLVFQTLLQPKTRVCLILGNPLEMVMSEAFSSEGFTAENLVIFNDRKEENQVVIHPGVSPSQISDALLEHLMIGPRLEGLGFELSLAIDSSLILLGILDWIFSQRLESRLHNDTQTIFQFSPVKIRERILEIRMGEDILWMSALIPFIFPDMKVSITEAKVARELKELVTQGYLAQTKGGEFIPNDFVIALSESILPLLSFGSCSIHDLENNSGFHLAFIVGVGTNLVIEEAPGENGKIFLNFSALSGVELSKLLFRIGLAEVSGLEAMDEIPARHFCSKCGNPFKSEEKFCTKCGNPRPGNEDR